MAVEGYEDIAGTCQFVDEANRSGEAKEGPPLAVCTWRGKVPRPLVLVLSCEQQSSTGAAPVPFQLLSTPSDLGVGAFTDWFGFADLFYGQGGVQHRRRFDIRDGSFQLPPCDYARLQLRRYHPNAGNLTVRCSASLVPGIRSDVQLPYATDYVVRSGASGADLILRAPGAWNYALSGDGPVPRDTQVFGPWYSIDWNVPTAFPVMLPVGVPIARNTGSSWSQSYGGASSTGVFCMQEIVL